MEHLINEFMEYLQNEKNISGNTELSYRRDLKKMVAYFDQAGVQKMEEVTEADLKVYLGEMRKEKFAPATISRNIASIRAFFHYLLKKGIIREDPS